MTSRPIVSVYSAENKVVGNAPMPSVFSVPIRDDIVQFVHSNMAKNRRQAHGINKTVGYRHSAESWGTGRAVARIPRISGSGTSRSGQGAFGNMCRKGGMFAPLKTWRKWHRKVNKGQKRHAVASALAACAVAPLVQARGHHVDNVNELPLVVSNIGAESTKAMLQTLLAVGARDDLNRVRVSKSTRAGSNKQRYSRFKLAKGPLVVYGNENKHVKRAARNLPGVDTCHVERLNLLQLAPGGHLGRFVIFTQDAFKALDSIYAEDSTVKKGYHLQRGTMTCADLARIINSDQVQGKLREQRSGSSARRSTKKNPLKNRTLMQRLNPFSKAHRALRQKVATERQAARKAKDSARNKKAGRVEKAKRTARFNAINSGLLESFKAAKKFVDEEEAAGKFNIEVEDD